MTSTDVRVGGVRNEVDYQKLGLALLIDPALCWSFVPPSGRRLIVTAQPMSIGRRRSNTAPASQKLCGHLTSRFPNLFLRKMCPGTHPLMMGCQNEVVADPSPP